MKKQNARERILETASDLFAARGYSTVGINEIIEKSETAKASFYHHFPSKETLCVTWLSETHARSDVRHEAILKAEGEASEKNAIETTLTKISDEPRGSLPIILIEGRVGIDCTVDSLTQDESRVRNVEVLVEFSAARSLNAMIWPKDL